MRINRSGLNVNSRFQMARRKLTLFDFSNSVADFELLVRDRPEAGAVCVELRLGTAGADVSAAQSYLQQLSDTLNDWERGSEMGSDWHYQQALIPADFPFCQLTQAELDVIAHGAAA